MNNSNTEWQPSSTADVAARRSVLLARARNYFDTQHVLAVDTPSLSSYGNTDPQIESMSVSTSTDQQYLHTSPEFCMKRLLAAGYPDIYSICRVYRDGERGRRHLAEFTMIEWYRRDFGMSDIIDDTVALIAAVLRRTGLAEPAAVWDYQDLFRDKLGVDPIESSIEQLMAIATTDKSLKSSLDGRRDGWLDLLLATKLAPTFADTGLTVVRHYPSSQAALARLCPDDVRVSDRFEVFFGSLELANGYVELIDAAEQSRRIGAELALRKERHLPLYPADELLLSALESGLPPCAGVALGFERLHMLDALTDDIHDVVTFAS